jgi:hypothetical protein
MSVSTVTGTTAPFSAMSGALILTASLASVASAAEQVLQGGGLVGRLEGGLGPLGEHGARRQQAGADGDADGACAEGALQQNSAFRIDHLESPLDRLVG